MFFYQKHYFLKRVRVKVKCLIKISLFHSKNLKRLLNYNSFKRSISFHNPRVVYIYIFKSSKNTAAAFFKNIMFHHFFGKNLKVSLIKNTSVLIKRMINHFNFLFFIYKYIFPKILRFLVRLH